MSTEAMVASVTKRLEMLQVEERELKVKQETLRDSLMQDEILIDYEEIAKEARKRATLCRQAILNEPENKALVESLKEIRNEIKDAKALLSGELIAVFMDSQSLEFETPDGELHRIDLKAKVKKTDQQSLFKK